MSRINVLFKVGYHGIIISVMPEALSEVLQNVQVVEVSYDYSSNKPKYTFPEKAVEICIVRSKDLPKEPPEEVLQPDLESPASSEDIAE